VAENGRENTEKTSGVKRWTQTLQPRAARWACGRVCEGHREVGVLLYSQGVYSLAPSGLARGIWSRRFTGCARRTHHELARRGGLSQAASDDVWVCVWVFFLFGQCARRGRHVTWAKGPPCLVACALAFAALGGCASLNRVPLPGKFCLRPGPA